MRQTECNNCFRLIKNNNYNKHIKSCKAKKELIKINNDWLQENGLYKCPYCEIEKKKNGIGTHIWLKHSEEGDNHLKNIIDLKKGKPAWNKGLTKETNEFVKLNSENVSKTYKLQIENGTYVVRKMGKEARKKLSIKQSLNNSGGKCKWFEISGQKVQGTWERDLSLKFEELKIDWYKPKVGKDVFCYNVDGIIKSYTPDFYLKEIDIYLELKGYWWGNDKEKMKLVIEQNEKFLSNLVLIQKKEFIDLLEINNKDEFLKYVQVTKLVKVLV